MGKGGLLSTVCPSAVCKTAGINKNICHWLNTRWLVSECVWTGSGQKVCFFPSGMDQRPLQELIAVSSPLYSPLVSGIGIALEPLTLHVGGINVW